MTVSIGLGQLADGLGWVGSHKMDPWTTLAPHTMRAVSIGNESVPIQLAQCWFPRLAISNAKNIDRRPISQTKYTEAILSNSTRKLIWLEIARMMIAV